MATPHRLRSGSAALLLALLLADCGPSRGEGSGNGVLVIAIDALRADHLSMAGYDRATTPVLDAVASQGVRFEDAYSTAPWLVPAHASILTGCDPLVSMRILPPDIPRSTTTLWHVPEKVPALAQRFLEAGWATAAFSDHYMIDPVIGFARGFRTFVEYEGGAPSELGIEAVSRRFEQWLTDRAVDEDWFAYLHLADLERLWKLPDPAWDTYFDPRESLDFVPPVTDQSRAFFAISQERWSGGAHTLGDYEARYDGGIRRVDQLLGRLFARMEQLGRLKNTTVVVVGTHGLGFGEAGLILDHGTFSDVDLHVPLIVRTPPGRSKPGHVAKRLVSTMDLAPTLLELEGLPIPSGMQGVSLAPLLAGGRAPVRRYAFARSGVQEGYAVIDERYCFEHTEPWKATRPLQRSWYGELRPPRHVAREVLHDRRKDPLPGHRELQPIDEEIAARMRNAGQEWIESVDQLRRSLQSTFWFTAPEDESK